MKKYKTLKQLSNCKIIEADMFEVFESNDNVALLQGCNCFHVMGGGIAKIIKDRYPKAYEADCRTTKGDKDKLGTYSLAKIKDEKYIVNIYTQYTFGQNHFGDREASYDAIYNGIKKLLVDIKNTEIKTVLIPYMIGCGLASGRIEIVETIINVLAGETEKEILICKLPE
jgi:O-acetyl-ADP-ribose deacetylase (regulator of RNase III)